MAHDNLSADSSLALADLGLPLQRAHDPVAPCINIPVRNGLHGQHSSHHLCTRNAIQTEACFRRQPNGQVRPPFSLFLTDTANRLLRPAICSYRNTIITNAKENTAKSRNAGPTHERNVGAARRGARPNPQLLRCAGLRLKWHTPIGIVDATIEPPCAGCNQGILYSGEELDLRSAC